MVSEPFKATQPSPGEAINPQVSATEALWWVALQARSNWKWARPAASPDNLLDKGGGDSTWKFTQDELHAVPDKLSKLASVPEFLTPNGTNKKYNLFSPITRLLRATPLRTKHSYDLNS
ncbi:hypothetical protein AFLA_001366 [Aspergillus flavus NRRL3357]|nr:hypothetical protein AFLA_001366 [Aspergillus flavus NRRL3357]